MRDFPAFVLAATIWAYWFCVGVMVVRVRRRTRKLAGVIPRQPLERFMWVLWVPLVGAWMVLPYLAATRTGMPWGLPAFAGSPPYLPLRWAGVGIALVCLALSIECWARMGKNWRMAVTPGERTDLVTSGLYGYIRHPIYALSILLMLCTVVVVPTLPVLAIAAIHVALMLAKARNEERFLAGVHGDAYRRYCDRTGRFLPRLGGRAGGDTEGRSR
jgi:protein-S-isoprenylcysteine O-methyltransferase Ste14